MSRRAVTETSRQSGARPWPFLEVSALPGRDIGIPEDTRAFIRVTRGQLLDNNGFQTAIRYRGDLVGVVGNHGVSCSDRSTSLGYWLTEAAQGRGIMTEAVRTYVQHAFETLTLNRVEIRCAAENVKSRAIPERLALQHEGTIQQAEWLYDHFVDHVVYGMLASAWKR